MATFSNLAGATRCTRAVDSFQSRVLSVLGWRTDMPSTRSAIAEVVLACWLCSACHPVQRSPTIVAPKATTPVAAPEPKPRQLPTLLLLSIDGLMPSQVLQAESIGASVPNLRRMVEQGAYATGVRTVVPSLTYPAHTTLVTGTSPAVHGILGNIVFDPMGKNKDGWYWYAHAIRVPTLWSAARQSLFVTANVCWPVSVGAHIDFNLVQFWRASLPEDEYLYRELSTSDLLDEVQAAVGPLPYGEDYGERADAARAKAMAYMISRKRPNFMTAYLGSLDSTEHETGPNSPEALEVLKSLDAHVGMLRAVLEAIAPGRAYLAVVSDHGFVPYHVEIELGALLRVNQLIDLGADGTVAAWRAAAWTAGGTAAIILRDPEDTATRKHVEELLVSMTEDSNYGIERIYRKSELASLEGFSNADYVLALAPGYKFGQKLSGPVFVQRAGGTHGYLPLVEDMDASFFIVGPGIAPARSLGRIDMRDVAPTVAGLLSLELPRAEGIDVLATERAKAPSQ